MAVPAQELPSLSPDHRLGRALRAASGLPASSSGSRARWPASFWGLADLLADRDAAEVDAALARLSDDLLAEALHVERAGMLFAAGMAQAAPTLEERAMYAVFGADEARHHAAIAALLPDPPPPPTAFHGWLHGAVTAASYPARVAVVQVVLEGWGLRHYRAMAEATTDAATATALRAILDDEARHHGSGALISQERGLGEADVQAAVGLLLPLLDALRAGPVGVADALTEVFGPVPGGWLARLDARGHAAARLSLLRELLDAPGLRGLLAALDARGALSLPDPGDAR
jgi:rubrerythrin